MSPSSLKFSATGPMKWSGRSAASSSIPTTSSPRARMRWRGAASACAISKRATSTRTDSIVQLHGSGRGPSRCKRHFFIGRDMTERQARAAAASVPEAGGRGSADRRHRARLQQYPHRHHRHRRNPGEAVADDPQLAATAKLIDEAAERGAELTQASARIRPQAAAAAARDRHRRRSGASSAGS